MNNEIKGILDILKTDMIHIRLFKEDRDKLLDYITNLQESEAYYYGQYKDYKLRNEKAIDYIKERYDYILKSDFLDHDEQVDKRQITYLLNILQGEDKDDNN